MGLSQRLGPAEAAMVEAFLGVLALVLWRLFPEADAHEAEGLLRQTTPRRSQAPPDVAALFAVVKRGLRAS